MDFYSVIYLFLFGLLLFGLLFAYQLLANHVSFFGKGSLSPLLFECGQLIELLLLLVYLVDGLSKIGEFVCDVLLC